MERIQHSVSTIEKVESNLKNTPHLQLKRQGGIKLLSDALRFNQPMRLL